MSVPNGWVPVPTKVGLYYHRVWGSAKNRVAEVWLVGDELVANTMDGNKPVDTFCRWWWGPLAPPAIPPPVENPMEAR